MYVSLKLFANYKENSADNKNYLVRSDPPLAVQPQRPAVEVLHGERGLPVILLLDTTVPQQVARELPTTFLYIFETIKGLWT